MTAFMLICYLGLQVEGSIYFKDVNDCMSYKKRLHNQIIKKDEKEEVYQCMCKLIPTVDPNKVKVY
jgi:hypothetical protein|tara:strand:- start:114 stop:311 length:198 start_codon:yes stop_codon:yes gene_type:complete